MDYKLITLSGIQENTNLGKEECRIRIYGNILGTTQDIINLWESIEKNYINIVATNKIIMEFMPYEKVYNDMVPLPYLPFRTRVYSLNNRITFIDFYDRFEVKDIIPPDEYPIITKINFNSPGFWEVIGQWNIFEQLRKYIQERHLRNRDKKYLWNLEYKQKMAEVESQQLSNDLMKLEITQKMIKQLKVIGLSDIEIRHTVQKSYGNLELLNSHIDEGRIVEIKKVDVEYDKI